MLLLFAIFALASAIREEPRGGSSYVAAVYEHSLVLNPEPRVPLSRAAALRHMKQNLDIYEEQAARASEQVRPVISIRQGLTNLSFLRLVRVVYTVYLIFC